MDLVVGHDVNVITRIKAHCCLVETLRVVKVGVATKDIQVPFFCVAPLANNISGANTKTTTAIKHNVVAI